MMFTNDRTVNSTRIHILGQETRSHYCPDSKHNLVRRETIGRLICEYGAT